MLASFTDLQTGHNSKNASHALQEQRCRHGSINTHDLLAQHARQTPPPAAVAGGGGESWQHDSASSAALEVEQQAADSLTCSRALLSAMAVASFSLANLCHASFSAATLLRHSSSSTALFLALTTSSSFCCSKNIALASIIFASLSNCWLLCCCKTILNLSFYKQTAPNTISYNHNPTKLETV